MGKRRHETLCATLSTLAKQARGRHSTRHCMQRSLAPGNLRGRSPKLAFELSAELRWAFVAHTTRRRCCADPVAQHQHPRGMQPHTLEVLKRSGASDGAKVLVECRQTHAGLF